MRNLIYAVRRWLDMNFTWKGLSALVLFIITAIPDWQSRGQYWNGRWHAITQFIVFSPMGRIVIILLGLACIALDHRSLMKRRKAEPLQRAKPRKPRLVHAAYQFVNVIFDSGIWREHSSQYASKAFVFHFTNEVYEDGAGEPANLRAQIAWVYENGVAGVTFSPAAWIDEEGGMVDIPVGWSKKLIIGVKTGSGIGAFWMGYSNPRIKLGDKHSLDGQALPLSGTMLIKLIGATNEVWYEQKFHYEEDLEGFAHPKVMPLSPQ